MSKKKQPSSSRPAPNSTPNARPTPPPPIRVGGTAATAPRPQSTFVKPTPPKAVTPSEPEVSLPIPTRPVAWWPPVVLALVGFLLYVNTFNHGYALDDIAAISQNLFVKAGLKGIPDLLRTEFWHFSNISLGYYRPLSLITFAIEHEFAGSNSGLNHQINTILYAIIGLVLGMLLQKWFVQPAKQTADGLTTEGSQPNRTGQIITALLIGLIFIAHPVHTEIVANIKGRDEILSFLFISLMLLFHWRYLETNRWGWIKPDARLAAGAVVSLIGGLLGGSLVWGIIGKDSVSLPNQIEAGVNLLEIFRIAAAGVLGSLLVTAGLSAQYSKKVGKQELWWNNPELNAKLTGVALTTVAAVIGAVFMASTRGIPEITTGKAIWIGLGAATGSLLVTSWLGLACASLYFAFLSKESSIVSIAFIPAAQYFFARRNIWRSLLSLWPFLIVAALFFYQKLQMIGTLSGKPPVDWANYPYAIEGTQIRSTFKFFAYYLKLLFLPHPLVYDYSYNVIPSSKGTQTMLVVTGLILMLGLIYLTIKGFFRRTVWGFALFWFFVAMAPGLGFIWMRGGILAERFLFAAVLGFAIVVVWGLQQLFAKIPAFSATQSDASGAATPRPVLAQYAPLIALLTVVLGLYSFKTVTRNEDWKNNFVLFNSALPYSPSSCQVQRHVANEWIEKGLKDRSKADSIANATNAAVVKLTDNQKRADMVKKAQVLIDTNVAAANKHGRWALDHLKEATQIYPGFGEAYFSMAYVFQKIIPNRDSAVYYYKQTIRAANAYAPAYNNLGVIYQNEGGADRRKLELASYYYNKSIEVNPAYIDGRNNHAALKRATGIDVKVLPQQIIDSY
ncbi:tetratricopeptide repeat protein [Rudanella paleaurantiibacter]|uniref:tetratricopeptide repeat protein n=1 Tax=Rudanella paleaurantiibacter TaxID=2614655 RepID=UPI00293BFDB2|nr:tetratricopeptide repeat protein [Rudanella paleaurantiibacter]